MGVTDNLTYLLRNLYVGQEAMVRTGLGTTNWFKIRKGIQKGCKLSPYLFNFYAEYIMWNARLDEAQAGIKIARRNINNFRYAGDTILMAEREEELKSLGKDWLETQHQKTKIMASSLITSWQIQGEKCKQWQILFSWIPKSLWMVIAAMKLKDACSLEEKLWPT